MSHSAAPALPAVVRARVARARPSAQADPLPSTPFHVACKVAKVTVVDLECLLLPEQAADVVNLAVKTLANDRVTAELGIPFVRIGRAVRYRPSDLRDFIAARVVRPRSL